MQINLVKRSSDVHVASRMIYTTMNVGTGA